MKLIISKKEKDLIKRFKEKKYPEIYKTDDTDNILFVETVDFDVCTFLLNGSSIDSKQYNFIMEEFQKYLKQIDINAFDTYALEHYNDIVKIMKIFKDVYENCCI